MRKYILAIALFCFSFCGGAFAREMEIRNVDVSGWPVVKVLVELPGGFESASAYQLSIMNPEVLFSAAEVQEVDPEAAPASTVVVLNTGGSFCRNHLDAAKSALSLYARMFSSQESIALLSCSSEALVLADFTQDKDVLRAALDRVHNSANKFDSLQAIREGMNLLQGRSGEKTLLVFSDGIEEADAANRKMVMETANANGIRIVRLDIMPLPELGPEISSIELRDFASDKLISHRINSSLSGLAEAVTQALMEKRTGQGQLAELSFDVGDELLVNPASTLFPARICAAGAKQQSADLVLDVSEAVEPYPGASVCLVGGTEKRSSLAAVHQ